MASFSCDLSEEVEQRPSRCPLREVLRSSLHYIKEALQKTFETIEEGVSSKLSDFLHLQKQFDRLDQRLKLAGWEATPELQFPSSTRVAWQDDNHQTKLYTDGREKNVNFGRTKSDLLDDSIHQFKARVKESEELLKSMNSPEPENLPPLVDEFHRFQSTLTSGSTASVVVIRDRTLYVANLGDRFCSSRCVMSRCGRIACLTEDHRLSSSEREVTRVNKTPQTFSCDGYLCGQLAVSRAFGNVERDSGKKLLGLLSAPDIIQVDIRQDDEFLIIGSDGLFDSLTPMDATVIVRKALQETKDLNLVAQLLVNHALEKSEDNISAIIVVFSNATHSPNASDSILTTSSSSSTMKHTISSSPIHHTASTPYDTAWNKPEPSTQVEKQKCSCPYTKATQDTRHPRTQRLNETTPPLNVVRKRSEDIYLEGRSSGRK